MTSTGVRPARDGKPAGSGSTRRAALVATAVALPVTVVLAFVLTSGAASDPKATRPLGAVTIAAPPTPSDATVTACTKVFEQLPVQLGGLSPRKTNSDSSFVAAWGDPAVIIRCGVRRPAVFDDPSRLQLVDIGVGASSVLWQPDPGKTATVYTSADRSVYVEVTMRPSQDVLPLLAPAITALPATCTGFDGAGNSTPGLPICANS